MLTLLNVMLTLMRLIYIMYMLTLKLTDLYYVYVNFKVNFNIHIRAIFIETSYK